MVSYIMSDKGSWPSGQELNSLHTTALIKAPQFPRLHCSFSVRHIAFTLTHRLLRLLSTTENVSPKTKRFYGSDRYLAPPLYFRAIIDHKQVWNVCILKGTYGMLASVDWSFGSFLLFPSVTATNYIYDSLIMFNIFLPNHQLQSFYYIY